MIFFLYRHFLPHPLSNLSSSENVHPKAKLLVFLKEACVFAILAGQLLELWYNLPRNRSSKLPLHSILQIQNVSPTSFHKWEQRGQFHFAKSLPWRGSLTQLGSVNSVVISPLRQAINHMSCQLVALILEILNNHKLDVGPRLRAHNLTSDIDLNHNICVFYIEEGWEGSLFLQKVSVLCLITGTWR